ncbi:c-type cytochrome [Azospirillum sp. SYSU D00513]|uniref:c-type cytochrome n=1 Tax=Azospirillum sp. SYSU D00513 TaxID=2812561 RepID=UPI001A95E53B|nr:c-type cytochrome [Azospirillum sp. SYSU D00513]
MRVEAMCRPAALLLAALLVNACEPSTATPSSSLNGDVQAGRKVVEQVECGVCHRIPGIPGAHGIVGPPLKEFGRRAYIAGLFPNRLDRLAHWVRNAPELAPGTAMPAMPINEREARDVAAFLHSLH